MPAAKMVLDPQTQRCSGCLFYLQDGGPGFGVCRRAHVHQLVPATSWCGQFVDRALAPLQLQEPV